MLVYTVWLSLALASPNPQLATHESRYYLIQTNLPADRAKWIGQVMDATGKAYHQLFRGFRGTIRQKPVVRVYASKEQYVGVSIGCVGSRQHTRGLYCPVDGAVYTYDGDGLEQVLKHECFHQFADRVVQGHLPRWTDEGLAEYFEESELDPAGMTLVTGRVPKWRLEILKKAIEQNRFFKVSHFLTITGREWFDHMAGRQGAVQYSQAWVLCHFLIHCEGGKYARLLDRFLGLVDEGVDGETAFKRVFGADTAPLDAALKKYIHELQPTEDPEPGE